MARIRTIKPEFWTSEQIVECSPTARLLFVGLWNFSDDAGRHPASVRRLKMEIFPADPFTPEDIRAWIDELIAAALLVEYEAEGAKYWEITGWKRHQKPVSKPTFQYPRQTSRLDTQDAER